MGARLPEHHAHHVARLPRHAGAVQSGLDVDRPGHHPLGPESVRRGQVAVYAVLQTEHDGIEADHRSHGRHGGGVLVGLDSQERQLHRANLCRVAGSGATDGELLTVPRHAQTALPDGRQVRPPRNQRHVVPAPRQHPAQVSADAARAHNRDSHDPCLRS